MIYCIIGINAIYCNTNSLLLFLFKDTYAYFIIFFSSPHLAIFICITSIFSMTTEPSDIGGMYELINKLLCLN